VLLVLVVGDLSLVCNYTILYYSNLYSAESPCIVVPGLLFEVVIHLETSLLTYFASFLWSPTVE